MNDSSLEVAESDSAETIRTLREYIAHQERLIEYLLVHLDTRGSGFPFKELWEVPKVCSVEKTQQISQDNKELWGVPKVRAVEKAQQKSQDNLVRLKATWIGKFYVTHVKRHPFLRGITIWMWRHFYPLYVNHVALTQYKTAGRWRHLVKLSEVAQSKVIRHIQLTDIAPVETPTPQVLPASDQGYLVSPHARYNFPSIYVTTINDGMIYGGTNLVLANEEVICHDLYDFRRDYTSEEIHGRNLINGRKRHIRWLLHDDVPEVLPMAATFVDACAPNYAHWLTEVLPRIATFCAEEKFNAIPIVVNDDLHKNIMESLFLITGSERDIITLPTGRAIQVNELLITSVTGYVPFERRNNKISGHSHGLFSPYAFDIVRNKIAAFVAGKIVEKDWPEKIYLRRNSGIRKVANSLMLEKLLVELGYLIVEPEKLTFLEQAQLFSHAKVIIGSSGAALANIIFAAPETEIYILISKYPDTSYWYWQNMACASGKTIRYILGEMVNSASGIHSDFTVNLDEISKKLKENS